MSADAQTENVYNTGSMTPKLRAYLIIIITLLITFIPMQRPLGNWAIT
jgi:hypothetical protein